MNLDVAVTLLQPHQNHETGTDAAHRFSFYADLRPGHPLDHHLHAPPPLIAESNSFSSRPPSAVTSPT